MPDRNGDSSDLETPPPGRIVLHVDMDSFFASVEAREHPELKGKPVVVGADPKQGQGRGVVSTCSYEARKYGIHSAMPISQAYQLCPHAMFLPVNFPLYHAVSARVMGILRNYAEAFQQLSIDEAYLDISGLGSYETAEAYARVIKEDIRAAEGITCSIGIGPGKTIAKIASDYQKPDGMTVVKPDGVADFLSPMKVGTIPGIGKKTTMVLGAMGIITIGQLAAFDVQELIARFGRGGIAMRELARGIDRREVRERGIRKSIGREVTFAEDTDDPGQILLKLDALAGDVHATLVHRGLRFKNLAIKVRYAGFATYTKSSTFDHFTDDLASIQRTARMMVREFLDDRKIRLIGIRLARFDQHAVRQATIDEFLPDSTA
ncbi:MAG: DNA polymerase IV [Methanomicrobiaceae archaeon]|nr:DNA polymerase IV [Methanomicrobiaceae archaeon]